MPTATAPIGVYDSGLGGLSVVRHLQRHLPQESIVYVADTARVPYGGRSDAEIRHFSREIIHFLASQPVKAIVCACNSSSVLILPELKRYAGIQVLGLAQAGSRLARAYRRLTLLATEATVRSGLYSRLVALRYPGVHLEPLACPEFVPLVESGKWSGAEVEAVVRKRLEPVLASRPEAVILGCSHYPYLAAVIQKVLGPEIALLDPAAELVHQLQARLQQNHQFTPYQQPVWQFYTTGQPETFRPLAERYLAQSLPSLQQTHLDTALPLQPLQPMLAGLA